MSRRVVFSLFAVAAVCLTGCQSARKPASMGMVSGDGQVLSLGAGDALGRAVYVNDMILAAAKIDHSTTYTNIDMGASEVLFDPRY
jgi:hypothetical protein